MATGAMKRGVSRWLLPSALAAAVVAAAAVAWFARPVRDTGAGRVDRQASAAAPAALPKSETETAPAVSRFDASTVAIPAPVTEAELDALKTEFADLMKKRSELVGRSVECRRLIVEGRKSELGSGAGANSETAIKYREALMAVEAALDNHPKIKALKALHEDAQTNKVAVSRQQAAILDVWRESRNKAHQDMRAAISAAEEKSANAKEALCERAGVKEASLLSSEGDRDAWCEIHIRFTNEVATARRQYGALVETNAMRIAREKDGSLRRFEEVGERYRELERRQADLTAEMNRLRTELRAGDPEIAALQKAAYAASMAHVAAMDSRPDVAEAKAFLRNVVKLQAGIDGRARALRRAILAADPELKSTLDAQSATGGLALVGEDFWNAGS